MLVLDGLLVALRDLGVVLAERVGGGADLHPLDVAHAVELPHLGHVWPLALDDLRDVLHGLVVAGPQFGQALTLVVAGVREGGVVGLEPHRLGASWRVLPARAGVVRWPAALCMVRRAALRVSR